MSDYPSRQRIDLHWLGRDLYPETIDVRPCFQDLDPLNHVKNVAMPPYSKMRACASTIR